MSTRYPDKSVAAESAQLDGQTIAQLRKIITDQAATIAQLRADLAIAQAGVSLIMADEPIRDRRKPIDEVGIAKGMIMRYMDQLAGNGSAIDLGDE